MAKASPSSKLTNKETLVASIAELSGLSKSLSALALNHVLLSIAKALKENKKVSLTGFGSFSAVELPKRSGHNPRTRETIKISAKKYPKFKAGKGLRNAIA